MSKPDIVDKYFDDVVKKASQLASEELGAQYLAEFDDGEVVEFSEEYKAKKAELFRQYRKKETVKKVLKVSKRIAVILLCIFVIGSSVTIFTVEALRIRIFNMVIEIFETYSKVNYREDNKGYSFSNDDIILGYVPEGFEIENTNKDNGRVFLRFSKDDKSFNISVIAYDPDWDNQIDTETKKSIDIEINGCAGTYVSDNDNIILTWHDNNYIYKLLGNIEKNDIIKIAENVKK